MASEYDVIVIGAGITGLTATRQLLRQGLAVANLEGGLFGGLVTNVNELDGAFAGSGADLASGLMMEVTDLGGAALSETAVSLQRDEDGIAITTDAAVHRAPVVVVASGATPKRLGVPGEDVFAYKGVSQCADCDGPMFQGQDVVVVGGGDSALQEALVLARYCARVHVVHRGAALAAGPHWIEALRARDNVATVAHGEVTAIEGADVVEHVRLRVGTEECTLPCAGVFVYVGLAPAAGFLPAAVIRDADGAVVVDTATLETALPGVFAAGAVRAGYRGALVHAVADAELAARSVLRRLRR